MLQTTGVRASSELGYNGPNPSDLDHLMVIRRGRDVVPINAKCERDPQVAEWSMVS